MRKLNSLGEAKNIEEGIHFLMKEYNYTREEVLNCFHYNEIMNMIDLDNRSDNSINLSIIEESRGRSYSQRQEDNLVMDCILLSANKNPRYIKYYSMIIGDIFHVGRKVTYESKRYSVFFSNDTTVFLTDTTRIVLAPIEEVSIIMEDLNCPELFELFEFSFDIMKENRKFGISKYIDIFCQLFDLCINKLISSLSKYYKESLIDELGSYLENNKLSYDISKV